MSKEPWFKLWAADYLTDPDVQKLPLDAQGLLLRLWCACWIHGSLPNDPEEIGILTLCRTQWVTQWLTHCMTHFEIRENRLFSPRMDKERAKSREGKKWAEKRWNQQDRNLPNGLPNAKPNAQIPDTREPDERKSQNLSSNDFELSPANGNGHHDPAQKQALLKVWSHYIEKTGRSEIAYRLTEKRSKVGMLRLKECQKRSNGNLDEAVNLMNLAVDKLTASNFHMGQNDTGKKYNDWIDNLFKSEEQMEKWWNA